MQQHRKATSIAEGTLLGLGSRPSPGVPHLLIMALCNSYSYSNTSKPQTDFVRLDWFTRVWLEEGTLLGLGPRPSPGVPPLWSSHTHETPPPYLPFRVRISDTAEGGRGGEDESAMREHRGTSSLTYSYVNLNNDNNHHATGGGACLAPLPPMSCYYACISFCCQQAGAYVDADEQEQQRKTYKKITEKERHNSTTNTI